MGTGLGLGGLLLNEASGGGRGSLRRTGGATSWLTPIIMHSCNYGLWPFMVVLRGTGDGGQAAALHGGEGGGAFVEVANGADARRLNAQGGI